MSRSRVYKFVAMGTAVLVLAACTDDRPADVANIPQGQPVLDAVIAARDDDMEAFREAFSERMRGEFEGDWSAVADDWTQRLADKGLTDLSRFYFDYHSRHTGTADQHFGIVQLEIDGQEQVVFAIAKDDGGWKIDHEKVFKPKQ